MKKIMKMKKTRKKKRLERRRKKRERKRRKRAFPVATSKPFPLGRSSAPSCLKLVLPELESPEARAASSTAMN